MSTTRSHYNRSTYSGSRSMSAFPNDLDELTDEELVQQVDDLKKSIQLLKLENEILENAIMRVEPELMKGVHQALDYATKIHTGSTVGLSVGSFIRSQKSIFGMESMFSPSRLLTSPSRVSTRRIQSSANIGGTVIFGTGPRINVMERLDIVNIEMDILKKKLDKVTRKAAKEHALLKAQLEEVAKRMSAIKKYEEEFRQEVMVNGWDRIAQRIPAEIWLRHMTEWEKACDIQIGKLRLRISTLNALYHKLKGQIRVKTELSQNLRPVDFEKLEIENNECEKEIEKNVEYLIDLKRLTGDANLSLTMHKKAMNEQNEYLDNVKNLIETKKRLTGHIDRLRGLVEVQAKEVALNLDDMKKLRLSWEVPDIMDYVQVKSELGELKQHIKTLENRKHIQHIALMSLNKQLNSMGVLVESKPK